MAARLSSERGGMNRSKGEKWKVVGVGSGGGGGLSRVMILRQKR